jgi:pyruvate carboxylase
MRRALSELRIGGIDTTVPFHRAVLDEPDFIAAAIDIRYVEHHPELMMAPPDDAAAVTVAVAAAMLEEEARSRPTIRRSTAAPTNASAWRRRDW